MTNYLQSAHNWCWWAPYLDDMRYIYSAQLDQNGPEPVIYVHRRLPFPLFCAGAIVLGVIGWIMLYIGAITPGVVACGAALLVLTAGMSDWYFGGNTRLMGFDTPEWQRDLALDMVGRASTRPPHWARLSPDLAERASQVRQISVEQHRRMSIDEELRKIGDQ